MEPLHFAAAAMHQAQGLRTVLQEGQSGTSN